jgi:hypothetical protein
MNLVSCASRPPLASRYRKLSRDSQSPGETTKIMVTSAKTAASHAPMHMMHRHGDSIGPAILEIHKVI